MKTRNFFIGLFVMSVVGLIYVQYQFLRVGLNLAAVQFDNKMGEVVTDIREGLEYENQLSFLLGKAITQDDSYFRLSIDSVQDASRFYLNDFVKGVLVKHGVNSDFTYRLKNKDTLVYLHSPEVLKSEGKVLSYPVHLEGYLPALKDAPVILELRFSDLNSYFMRQLNGLTIPGAIFLLIITAVVIWVLKGFLQQRSLITVTNEFINNLTHELKTPVFSIGLATKLLAEREDVDKKEVAGIIRVQLDKLKAQIDRVLELAGLEEKGEVLKRTRLDLAALLRESAEEFEGVAALEAVDFSTRIPEGQVWVKGMKSYLKNVTDTLLDNAKKYSADPKRIVLALEADDKYARICVEDNGIGIPKEDQKRIFEKFYRVSSGDLHAVKGYGLGLHFVKRITELHKGKVLLRSQPGSGSVFTIQIPLI
ncbi:HAMP domain-containing histidine kinase [Robertkochia marina]|uniref:histidine kinase n=2 Tax=Robertkochia marina TaxID=1227945 RepID=A0A4S3M4I2_9FLAO|nr:HAMP domain-containing histidine kinase [Robertkochia marina]TRZ46896.1 sensor histidine kinase [Robertkochia marina]